MNVNNITLEFHRDLIDGITVGNNNGALTVGEFYFVVEHLPTSFLS
jgi:hypothetical protein